jgi:thiol-disulfide isomerase/thioredoxin
MLTAQLATLILAVTSGGDTVLLDFRADWCGPCRSMDPVVQQLAAEGYPVRQVNIDQQRDLAAKYHIGSIPCFVLVVDGREIDRSVGASSGSTLAEMFRKAGYDPKTRTAAAAADSGHDAASKQFPAQVSDELLTGATFVSSSSPSGADDRFASSARDRAANSGPPIACCVRLKVSDPKGNSVGSGTIIDSRKGEALILTCGHIFRDSDGKGEISVDLFGAGAPQHVAGRLIGCDLDRDVALVGMSVKTPVAAARVAPASYAVHKGDHVVTIGCSNGEDPTLLESHVDSLDRFSGPDNIQVAGQPAQGRSGGGLFNAEGQVIGVCNAADPSDNEGLFAALTSVYKELDRASLSFVYRDVASMPTTLETTAANSEVAAMPAKMPPGRGLSPFVAGTGASPVAEQKSEQKGIVPLSSSHSSTKGQLTTEEAATLAELREKARGAEVICIVRPSSPGAKSEIIVLDKASQAFLNQLSGEQQPRPSRRLTSLDIPAEARPNSAATSP